MKARNRIFACDVPQSVESVHSAVYIASPSEQMIRALGNCVALASSCGIRTSEDVVRRKLEVLTCVPRQIKSVPW